jgi:hypothetical protein
VYYFPRSSSSRTQCLVDCQTAVKSVVVTRMEVHLRYARDDGAILIHARLVRYTLTLILGFPWLPQSFWSMERHARALLAGRVRMHTLQRGFLRSLRLGLRFRGCSVASQFRYNTYDRSVYSLRRQPCLSCSLWRPF